MQKQWTIVVVSEDGKQRLHLLDAEGRLHSTSTVDRAGARKLSASAFMSDAHGVRHDYDLRLTDS
jgi:hypothetical protein